MIHTLSVVAAGGQTLELKQSWDRVLKSIITSSIGNTTFTFITAIGVLLIVGAFFTWLWQRRRGQGANMNALMGAGLIGIALSAPMVLIPAVLIVIDKIGTIVVGLAGKIG